MAGAIAGTALVNYASSLSDTITTITLTINNACNLKCPHCYLQYNGSEETYITNSILDQLFGTDFKHLVIVGKEPFLNKRSVQILEEIAIRATDKNRTVGVITNGLGLDKLTRSLADKLAYIDVSFDGGVRTYEKYRKGNFQQLAEHINAIKHQYGFSDFNALHVVNSFTIDNIDDMIDVKNYGPFKSIMFSPYLETKNDGRNFVERLSIEEVLKRFSKNEAFLNTAEAFILLDTYHLMGDDDSVKIYSEFEIAPNLHSIKELIFLLGLESKVKLIEHDPILHGFVRLTYDGFLLSPFASLNPGEYRHEGSKVSDISIDSFFVNKTKALLSH